MTGLALATRGYVCGPPAGTLVSGVEPDVITSTLEPEIQANSSGSSRSTSTPHQIIEVTDLRPTIVKKPRKRKK